MPDCNVGSSRYIVVISLYLNAAKIATHINLFFSCIASKIDRQGGSGIRVL